MEKLQPKAVIFDLGSTLIEYETIPYDKLGIIASVSVHKYLLEAGKAVPPEHEFVEIFENVKNEFRRPARENLTEWAVPQAAERLLHELKIEDHDGLTEQMFEAYYKPVAEQIYAYDDTVDTLKKIKDRGLVVGLVSNTVFPEQTHRNEMKRFKLQKYFDFAIFSSTFGRRKPHPDIFYAAANMAGFAPAECVYIGDRFVEDYQGPTGIGMPAILKILSTREYPGDMPADIRTIRCLSDLDNYLDI